MQLASDVLPARPGAWTFFIYVKCNAEIDVSVPPYFPSSLTLE
jgi:hypothetical protein